MARSGLKIEGLDELIKQLKYLDEKGEKRARRKAVNAGANPVVKAVKSHAPKQSGTLKKSIGKKIKQYRKGDVYVAVVGARKKTTGNYKGETRIPFYYAHLVEKGFINKQGYAVPAQPFIRPGFKSSERDALKTMRDKLGTEIVAEAKKGK